MSAPRAIAATLLVLVVAPLGARAVPATVASARPKTLVSVGDSISGFAQDGPRIAWLTAKGRFRNCVRTLHIRFLPTKRTSRTLQRGCYVPDDSTELALAGRAAVWQNWFGFGISENDVDVWTASAGARRAHRVEQLQASHDPESGLERAVLPLVGAGKVLVYDAEQDFRVPSERAIRRIVAGARKTLFAFDRPLALAVDAGRIAAVRQRLVPGTGELAVAGEIHSTSGALISSFDAPGVPNGLALGGNLVALITRLPTNEAAWIRLFDASTGLPRQTLAVPVGSILARQGSSGRWVVFRNGRTIRVLDTETMASSTLAVAPVIPVGLSVSGRRVAWAENFLGTYAHPTGTARIRALLLPSSSG